MEYTRLGATGLSGSDAMARRWYADDAVVHAVAPHPVLGHE